ncbi:hypothetical protein [Frankia sp. Cr2]|uniref:hypothetical protein n=1 Tax=Frankia sp. Cr2 TaxID=3073932 RepID=UPI002AD2FD05|nr:hypothetical protein [Frankia sp. Cr2]
MIEPPAVPLLVLRCPEHSGPQRRGPHDPLKGPRPGVRCENCRIVWADGYGPDADPDEPPDLGPLGPIRGPS